MKPCAHVVCKVCVDELVRAAKQCIVCDHTLADDDIIELKREGTFRNSFWPFVTRSDSVIVRHWIRRRRSCGSKEGRRRVPGLTALVRSPYKESISS